MPGTNIHSTETSLQNYMSLVSDSKSKSGTQCDEIQENKACLICSLREGKVWSSHTNEATKPVFFWHLTAKNNKQYSATH